MHQSPSSQPRANWELGCIFRVGVLLAICVGVLLVMRLGTPEQPRQTAVRVIDDSASPGPKVIATRVVPLCVTGESERRFRLMPDGQFEAEHLGDRRGGQCGT